MHIGKALTKGHSKLALSKPLRDHTHGDFTDGRLSGATHSTILDLDTHAPAKSECRE